ncbi:MAG: orotate phosphoribosyltransferase [Turneriella sp.]|nr:orotate phosphoribosyltransferase [Leptospiraceae bacterium]MCX7631957.1 orotate phosphoribosyltransferase [Turneriella sp.]
MLDGAHENLREAIRRFSYRENHAEPFTLASGKKSPYYFDLKQTLLQPEYLNLVGRIMVSLIAQHYSGSLVAAGLTLGADPVIYATAMAARAQALQVFPAIVRKEAKDHGTGRRIEMVQGLPTQTPCVLIDDVVTTGSSTLKALEAMRAAGFSVRHAFAVLDRNEGGREALAAQGVTLIPIFTLDDFREN